MNIIDVLLIGIALAMDAFALTIANCTTYNKKLNKLKEWSMPTAFAVFQFLMPVIGFYLGTLFSGYIKNVAGYITAAVFFVLSLKIVYDNVKEIREKKKNTEEKEIKHPEFTFVILLIQAVATSIDAFFVGVTFAVKTLPVSIFIAGLIIGAITFVICAVALLFGKYLGKLLGKYAEWAGAIILLALAIKELVQAIIG